MQFLMFLEHFVLDQHITIFDKEIIEASRSYNKDKALGLNGFILTFILHN